jgi:transposase InsO family protein
MSQRLRLVEQLLLPGANVSKICSDFGVSRKTAYKWLNRFKKVGPSGLSDLIRTPISQPAKVTLDVEKTVIKVHKANPYWGPFKLQQYLINKKSLKQVPCPRTVGRILKRNGCEVIKSHKTVTADKRFEKAKPNDLWQMDFKGSFMTQENRCHPLTVLDDHSRFSIGLKACKDEKGITVKQHLTALFKEYGLPEQINVDNGSPWGSTDLENLTALDVWLIKLGVKLTHSAPYHPQTNGKDERFHRTLKLEVLHDRLYRDEQDIQAAFDQWRHIYNFDRPHQGIGNKPPCSRYHTSARRWSDSLLDYGYGSDEVVRKVAAPNATFGFRGRVYKAGKALRNEYIAIRETKHSDQFAIYFKDRFVKKFQIKEFIE